ncbi:MAG: hypothetical protein HYX48_06670 [Chlamydiales bacterium]|nr:hypothetical protein [Chlamydiales bacterium]
MRFRTLAQSVFSTSLLATSLVLGDQSGSGVKDTKMQTGYNSPCRISVDRPYDFFLSGSFIYWQPIQENMQLGVVSKTSSQDLVNGHEIDLDFDYKPGFKVGLGMNFSRDNWDTFIEYTWFRATEHVRKKLNPNNTQTTLLPAWQIPDFLNPKYSSGSEKWKLRMDLIDWDLAKSYKIGTKLCLRPFFGVRAALIDQKVKVDYVNVTSSALLISPSTSIRQSSDSWGVGPRAGLSSHWKFCKNFRLFSSGEVDILFTQYDLKSSQTGDPTVANRYIVKKNDANYLRTHLELNLGLGWGSYFASDRYHVDLSAGYGFQVFFDQNMFRNTSNTDAVGKGTWPNGNLYIQGLTTSLRFDF